MEDQGDDRQVHTYEFMDPEEIPLWRRRTCKHYRLPVRGDFELIAYSQFYMRQRTAFVMYFKWRHKQGHYVKLCVSTSVDICEAATNMLTEQLVYHRQEHGLLTHWSEGDS